VTAIVFLGLPGHVWWALLVALALGITALFLARRFAKDTLPRELVRDVGVAFIVAVVVSAIYEYSTRSIEKRHVLLDSINQAMSSFVPESVWTAVKEQVIRRNAVRKNVDITIRVGRRPSLRPGQAVLWMSYAYDLYGLSDEWSTISVSHELDDFMRNNAQNLPRFERVLIIGPEPNDRREYSGNDPAIARSKGRLELTGEHAIRLPPAKLAKPVRIVTERYEIVNTPGYYYLVMRELTTKDDCPGAFTVKVSFESVPRDIDASVSTYYDPHEFVRPDPRRNVWYFHKTLLPGQGLTILFTDPAWRAAPPEASMAPASPAEDSDSETQSTTTSPAPPTPGTAPRR
jgi:hypothetical protein